MELISFASKAEWRAWLANHHDRATEIRIQLHKGSGLRYKEALDEALCFGWIDGVRKNVDAASYQIRFSPRKAAGIWSNINIRRALELQELGLMEPPGLHAFANRKVQKSGIYSYENQPRELSDEFRRNFQAHAQAWTYFESQAPSYQRTAIWWVMGAKTEVTRQKRLATWIDDSGHQRQLAHLSKWKGDPKFGSLSKDPDAS